MTPASARVRVLLLSGREPGDALLGALDDARAAALGALLGERASTWARASFPDGSIATSDAGLAETIASLRAGPPPGADDVLVLLAPELAVWRDDVAAAALGDVRDGCALSFGPVFDGGLYLLALRADAVASLGEDPGVADLAGRGALSAVVALAERAGWEVGMMRTERGLRTEDDLQALLVDPLTDDELRAVLG